MSARYPSTVMVSVVCPWNERNELDEKVFREAIRFTRSADFRHIYVFGTAGEGHAVDMARFRRVVEVFGDELLGTDARPMVGVIAMSVPLVLERLRIAHDQGFREFQISLPSWSPLGDEEVFAFFREVCGSFPDSTFMHYNSAKTGRVLSGSHYRRLVEENRNLAATKHMAGDLASVASVVRDAPELMHFLTEQSVAYGSLFGECAILGTFGALAPKREWDLLAAVRAGRHHEAAAIGSWFERVSHDLFDSLMVDRRPDGAYDKTILKLVLPQFPLRMLPPYRCISDEEFSSALAILRARYPDHDEPWGAGPTGVGRMPEAMGMTR
ncbi:MAG: dihydrodipicolinate synthase family protein [Chloroflexi bacterium]|nr:dihydrodipicolinate synthase family protein [Chloroflexota bacterium]